MLKIGEFSKLTQISIRMLRYYDETGLLKPAAIDPQTGYRLYSSDQLTRLNQILTLRDCGFTISEISAMMGSQSLSPALIEAKQKEIQQIIAAEQIKLKRLESLKQRQSQGHFADPVQIVIKAVPACHVLSLRRVIPDYYAEGALWQAMAAFVQAERLTAVGQAFSIFHDEAYQEKNVDVELCLPVKQSGKNQGDFRFRDVEGRAAMASTFVCGPFSEIAGAYRAFVRWLEENGSHLDGPDRQIVHRGPWNETDPRQYLTEIQIPVRKETEVPLG